MRCVTFGDEERGRERGRELQSEPRKGNKEGETVRLSRRDAGDEQHSGTNMHPQTEEAEHEGKALQKKT